MLPHPLTSLKTQKYYQNKPKLNGAYSRNSLSKIKDMNIVNLDEYESIAARWIALHLSAENIAFFDSIGVNDIVKNQKLENSLEIKVLQKIFIEYKHLIQ